MATQTTQSNDVHGTLMDLMEKIILKPEARTDLTISRKQAGLIEGMLHLWNNKGYNDRLSQNYLDESEAYGLPRLEVRLAKQSGSNRAARIYGREVNAIEGICRVLYLKHGDAWLEMM